MAKSFNQDSNDYSKRTYIKELVEPEHQLFHHRIDNHVVIDLDRQSLI